MARLSRVLLTLLPASALLLAISATAGADSTTAADSPREVAKLPDQNAAPSTTEPPQAAPSKAEGGAAVENTGALS